MVNFFLFSIWQPEGKGGTGQGKVRYSNILSQFPHLRLWDNQVIQSQLIWTYPKFGSIIICLFMDSKAMSNTYYYVRALCSNLLSMNPWKHYIFFCMITTKLWDGIGLFVTLLYMHIKYIRIPFYFQNLRWFHFRSLVLVQRLVCSTQGIYHSPFFFLNAKRQESFLSYLQVVELSWC